MTEDRWQQIVDHVRSSFEVEDFGREENDELGGTRIEYIIFTSPAGRLRLEFSSHPAILESKTIHKKSAASEIRVEHEYSAMEESHTFEVWRWNEREENWEPFRSAAFQ